MVSGLILLLLVISQKEFSIITPFPINVSLELAILIGAAAVQINLAKRGA